MLMFDYDRDIMQPPEEREELDPKPVHLYLAVGSIDTWGMKYDSGATEEIDKWRAKYMHLGIELGEIINDQQDIILKLQKRK